jgi:hypothetical protein
MGSNPLFLLRYPSGKKEEFLLNLSLMDTQVINGTETARGSPSALYETTPRPQK